MAEVRARRWRKAAYARSGDLYDAYGIRASLVSIGRPPSLGRQDAQWSGISDKFRAGKALVLNNIPHFWHINSISNWASQFGTLKLVALDDKNTRAVIEFCDSECARAAYESEAFDFCPKFYACYWEPSREALASPTDEQSASAPPPTSMRHVNWSNHDGGPPPLSPTLTETYSETSDMAISVLTSEHTFSLEREASDYVPPMSSRPDEGCTQEVLKASGDVAGLQGLVEADSPQIHPPSPTCTEGYSDDEGRELPTATYFLSCQIGRKLQRQATLAEVKSFSLEVESILRGVEDTARHLSTYLHGPPALAAHAGSTPYPNTDDKPGVPTPPDMTLQVSLERPAYIQRIGKQLKDLLDIYDGLGSTVSQRDQLLESMRIIKRELDALDEEDTAYKEHKTWLASKTISRWTRHRYPFAGWTAPLGNACTSPIDIV